MKSKKVSYSKPELFINIVEFEDVILLSSGQFEIGKNIFADDSNAGVTEIL